MAPSYSFILLTGFKGWGPLAGCTDVEPLPGGNLSVLRPRSPARPPGAARHGTGGHVLSACGHFVLQIRTTKVPGKSYFCSAAENLVNYSRAYCVPCLNGVQEAAGSIPSSSTTRRSRACEAIRRPFSLANSIFAFRFHVTRTGRGKRPGLLPSPMTARARERLPLRSNEVVRWCSGVMDAAPPFQTQSLHAAPIFLHLLYSSGAIAPSKKPGEPGREEEVPCWKC